MSNILKMYKSSEKDNVVKARNQSDGKTGVNHFDNRNVFSKNFTPRDGKEVQLSNDPNDTKGNFTEFARNYYDEELKDIVDERYQKYNRNNKYPESI